MCSLTRGSMKSTSAWLFSMSVMLFTCFLRETSMS